MVFPKPHSKVWPWSPHSLKFDYGKRDWADVHPGTSSRFLPSSAEKARSFSASIGTCSQPPPSQLQGSYPPRFLPLLRGAIPRLCETDSSSLSLPAPWLLLRKAIPSVCYVQVPPRSTCVSWAAGGGRPSVGCMHFVIRHWRDEVRILPALSRVQILPTATRTTDTQNMDFSLPTKALRIFNCEV